MALVACRSFAKFLTVIYSFCTYDDQFCMLVRLVKDLQLGSKTYLIEMKLCDSTVEERREGNETYNPSCLCTDV